MRVIAGLCRGRNLKSVKGLATRPTADRVKEAIFNVLNFKVQNAVFLDLFAGTGSMGIEALSRGGKLSVFVEKEKKAIKVLQENLLNCQLEEYAQVYPTDYGHALKLLHKNRYKFNLVYLDPPYKLMIIDNILKELVSLELLIKGAIVIAETDLTTQLTQGYKKLFKVREDKYGDTKITYYQLNGED
ncbi:MAG: 16S rRNA (guanine(966)-N(2))-methyltransferase RsmD [Peptococcales bacterium]|jgi:16S rRNA (guanine966-N2)-methyltransferase